MGCNKEMGRLEEDKPGVFPSHGYCPPCLETFKEKIEREQAELCEELDKFKREGQVKTEKQAKKITSWFLIKLGACEDQLALFKKVFPRGAELSEADVVKAAKAGLHVGWLAENTLSGPALAEYEKVCDLAWSEFEKGRNLAWSKYEKVRVLALAKYRKVRVLALTEDDKAHALAKAEYEYEKAYGPALAEYEKVYVLAWTNYEKVCGLAWLGLYTQQLKNKA